MRVLYVNWVDDRDPRQRGGGVAVYQRLLIDTLAAMDGIQVSFLASGLAHDLRGAAPRVVALPSVPGQSVRRYQMVNSGVLAPSHADFGSPAQLDHLPTVQAFAAFVDRTGPYDVIHYNNLEGLPAQVLALSDRWPGTRQILSLHNYYPICPQVNLWSREARACTDFDGGTACVGCLPNWPDRRPIRTAYAVEWRLRGLGLGPGTRVFDRMVQPSMGWAWRTVRRLLAWRPARADAVVAAIAPVATTAPQGSPVPGPLVPPDPAPTPDARARAFAERRARMVGLINAHCDQVLCVSDRVRQIAVAHGISPRLAVTCPIGSAQAEAWGRTAPRASFVGDDGTLRLAYLGYMRRDKGFPFLLDALAQLPPDAAARLHLTVAARSGDAAMMAALAALRPRLAGLRHVDGYGHADLDALLADVDLGLVPVMWEDNLPQVAIEMHARHIPLLCSDMGGARELGNCPALVHCAGDAADFARALTAVLDGRVSPADYWRSARPPTDPARHVADLLAIYASSWAVRSA
jgi:glycosyltransferase involved in cell wall biosynthesis